MDKVTDYWTGILAFVRTMDTGSFTAAGRQLGVTPSSVGRAVARLENRLGTTLLTRSTRALVLTAEGRRFLEQVAPAIETLREAEGAVGSPRPPAGTVRVSASIDLGRMLVASWIKSLARDYPDLAIELNVTDRLVDLRREGVDIAVRQGSLPPSTLENERVGAIGYAVVAAPVYLAARGTPHTPSDLIDHACLQYLKIDGSPLRWTFAGQEIATFGPLATDDGGALRTAACHGAGIAYMLRFSVADALADGSLIELFADVPKPELTVSLSHPFGTRPPARVRAVLDHLRRGLTEAARPGAPIA